MDERGEILISVLIAAYNCADSVLASVGSILAERDVPLEVIVVDDASTDTTPAVLDWLASYDERVRVVHRETNGGEGPCRESGLAIVRGAWLLMLDADDLIVAGSLSKLASHLETTQADVVLSSHYRYDVPTQVMRKVTLTKVGAPLPSGPFDPAEYADDLFSRAGSGIANKVFRMERIRSEGVHFQDVERIGDVHFTLGALATARLVEFVDIPHYYYRVRLSTSLTHAGVKYPLSFAKACYGLQDFLMEKGLWERWKISFLNWVVALLPYNLSMMESYEACHQLAKELYEHGFPRMEFDTLTLDKCPHPRRYMVCDELHRNGPENGIYALMRLNRTDYEDKEMSYWSARSDLTNARADLKRRSEHIGNLERVISEKDEELYAVWHSASMRFGRAITAAPRIARDLLKRTRAGSEEPRVEPPRVQEEKTAPAGEGAPKPLVSIIVPVDDASKDLRACLTSICKQDFPDYEICVVAGAGNEEARRIVSDFASQGKRVALSTLPRFDVLLACRQAVKMAQGTWLCLVDPEDYLYPEFIGAALGVALGAGTAIGVTGVVSFEKKPPRRIASLPDIAGVYDAEAYGALDEGRDAPGSESAYGKVFDRTRLDAALIEDGVPGGHTLVATKLLEQSGKVSVVGLGLYAHRTVSAG